MCIEILHIIKCQHSATELFCGILHCHSHRCIWISFWILYWPIP